MYSPNRYFDTVEIAMIAAVDRAVIRRVQPTRDWDSPMWAGASVADVKRTELAELIRDLMDMERWTVPQLHQKTGLSEPYLYKLRSGVDSRTKQPIRPTFESLRILANGLANGDPEKARRYYEQLLVAAKYLHPQGSDSDHEIESVGIADTGRESSSSETRVITRGVDVTDRLPAHVRKVIDDLVELTERLNMEERDGRGPHA
jgi:transcriptional regulator with XRE-family HTH domain